MKRGVRINHSYRIAAVVATHNRPGYLANRSLASIAAQTRPPDLLVVVDDSDAGLRRTNGEITADFAIRGARVVYLENYRTPGASGAWNTALAYLQRTAPDCFVAILDDDDAWERTYLQRCEEAVLGGRLDMVAAGLLWRQSPDDPGSPLDAPERLDAGDFLTGNPHIQGSNLFVRLRTLLEAGAFDESLPSATDRDLCIRLADLGDAPLRAFVGTPGSPLRRRGASAAVKSRFRCQASGPATVLLEVPFPNVGSAARQFPRPSLPPVRGILPIRKFPSVFRRDAAPRRRLPARSRLI